MTPGEYLESKGIDTSQIVAYFCRDGVDDGIDIDIIEIMKEYALHVAQEAVEEEMPNLNMSKEERVRVKTCNNIIENIKRRIYD